MRRIWIAAPLMACTLAVAKLPPPDDAAKAKAAEAAAKTAWSSKVDAFQLCQAQNRVVKNYQQNKGAKATQEAPAQPLPECTDPGPFVSAQAGASARAGTKKDLESAGAHSPPTTAAAPPVSAERKEPAGSTAPSAPATAGSATTFSISPGGGKPEVQAVPIPPPVPLPTPAVPARATTASPAAVPDGASAPSR